jgi:2-oxoglutarate dehydrogenase E2 component (dihydrolipoamide succinyltransferase)
MIIEINIPSPGESITEVELANWFVEDGEFVEKDQEIAEIESDKATLTLNAEENGQIKIIAQAGTTVDVGAVACTINTEIKGKAKKKKGNQEEEKINIKGNKAKEISESSEDHSVKEKDKSEENTNVKLTPLAKKQMKELNLSVNDVINGLKKITTKEIDLVKNSISVDKPSTVEPIGMKGDYSRETENKKLTTLRKKISERLVQVKNETAMLTTFNEVDMSNVMALRKKYQKQFQEKHGIKLGFMSFFTKAVTNALKLYPNVNAMLDGEEIIYRHYSDIAIAVQTPKGLMVPVIRNTESMELAELEKNIMNLANKARTGKITIDELTGGTFTITNGGIFGSLLSTPILNPPQSGILGMHNIVERPVAINGKVEIRPMMYVALSYDHRIIDGRDSVGFLVKVKEMIENPYKMLLNGNNPENLLLNL